MDVSFSECDDGVGTVTISDYGMRKKIQHELYLLQDGGFVISKYYDDDELVDIEFEEFDGDEDRVSKEALIVWAKFKPKTQLESL